MLKKNILEEVAFLRSTQSPCRQHRLYGSSAPESAGRPRGEGVNPLEGKSKVRPCVVRHLPVLRRHTMRRSRVDSVSINSASPGPRYRRWAELRKPEKVRRNYTQTQRSGRRGGQAAGKEPLLSEKGEQIQKERNTQKNGGKKTWEVWTAGLWWPEPCPAFLLFLKATKLRLLKRDTGQAVGPRDGCSAQLVQERMRQLTKAELRACHLPSDFIPLPGPSLSHFLEYSQVRGSPHIQSNPTLLSNQHEEK